MERLREKRKRDKRGEREREKQGERKREKYRDQKERKEKSEEIKIKNRRNKRQAPGFTK